MIGDTDTAVEHDPELPVASGADVDYLLAKANALLRRPLQREDVRGVFAGIRPLRRRARRRRPTRPASAAGT